MVSRTAENSGSDEVSCLRASSLASENYTKHTFCKFNDSLLGKGLSLDIRSARSISVPGLFLIVLSYLCILSCISQLLDYSNESFRGACDLTPL